MSDAIRSGTMINYAMTLSIEALEGGKLKIGVPYGVGWTCGFTFCEAYIKLLKLSIKLHQADVQAKDRSLYAIFQIRIESRKCNNELQTHL